MIPHKSPMIITVEYNYSISVRNQSTRQCSNHFCWCLVGKTDVFDRWCFISYVSLSRKWLNLAILIIVNATGFPVHSMVV